MLVSPVTATLGSARGTAASRSLRALGVRAKRSAAERNALLQAGTARLLTDKIGRHPDDVDIALEATEALAALAEGIAPEGKTAHISCGGKGCFCPAGRFCHTISQAERPREGG
jgi:hypothetical protein